MKPDRVVVAPSLLSPPLSPAILSSEEGFGLAGAEQKTGVPSSVPKLPNEVTLRAVWFAGSTVSHWGYAGCLQFGQFVIGRSAVQVRSSAPVF